ncbi:MAG: hypothetical protein RLZZ301_1056 [Bacteroidota bacterium]|jgi:alanine racemase
MKLNLNSVDFARHLEAACVGKPTNDALQEVVYDTRRIRPIQGQVFFALEGPQRSGFQFLDEAYQKGIRFFVVHKTPVLIQPDATYFLVKNPLVALQKLAAWHRTQLTYPIVAICGQYGKTTVKEWIHFLLSGKKSVFRSPKSYNSQLGIALSLLELPPNADLGLIEVAFTTPDEMQRIVGMLQPSGCVLTTKSYPQQYQFESREAYLAALDQLTKAAQWTIDGDQLHASPAFLSNCPFQDSIRRHNAQLALECAQKFAEIEEHELHELPQLAMRLEHLEGIDGSRIINDTYTLDAIAFEASLSYLKSMATSQDIMVICYLGNASLEVENQLKEALAQHQIQEAHLYRTLPTALPSVANKWVLLKGNEHRITESWLEQLTLKKHITTVSYDLAALRANLARYQERVLPSTQLLAMVKAQAYGGGATELAKALVRAGVHYLGVAYVDEGIELRNAGITLPILVMNPEADAFGACIDANLEPAIYSLQLLDQFIRKLISKEQSAYPIHLKFDTGMHRLGFESQQWPLVLEILQAQPEVMVKSVYSHLADADQMNSNFTQQQITLFTGLLQQIRTQLPYPILGHLLNSEGTIHYSAAQFDLVRLGIGLFGINQDPVFQKTLQPVVSWHSAVSQIKVVKAGEYVGYNCSFQAVQDVQIAIIPVGYADGFKRNLSNGVGGVFIGNRFCPTLGRVCMDMIMVEAPHAKEGDLVEIIGPNQSLQSFAEAAQTIPYEILTSISQRVHRVYRAD